MVAERIPRKFGLDPIDDIQVMAPLHAGTLGVAALNELLQRELNPAERGRAELPRGSRVFRTGDKVMQIRNNYDKDVFNGDVGKIIQVEAAEQRLIVSFGNGPAAVEIEYEAADLDELVLAYAVSVHKAQGSEFPCIVMPLVTRHFIMLQRHLLYTAITRARNVCVLVGSERALAIAAATDRREHRNTRLGARVAGHDYAEQLELV
jgi:exodeoxyribonuclease V alpha subunit